MSSIGEITVKLDFTEAAGRLRAAADALVGQAVGDRVEDGGSMGTLVRCHECDGTGRLHQPDEVPGLTEPSDV